MSEILARHFADMGARVEVTTVPVRAARPALPPVPAGARVLPWRSRSPIDPPPVLLDVREDRHGETFTVRQREGVELQVIDRQPADRHLLLLAVEPNGSMSRFLCGHDERHWFVAAIPETERVTTVRAAKLALQPPGIAEAAQSLRPSQRLRRRTKAYSRQGEWFFVPAPELRVPPELVLRDEPLRRGRGKPHTMQFAYRCGGQTVYVSRVHPNGLTQSQYEDLSEDVRRKAGSWRTMLRDAEVFAKGKISHADHATLVLPGWHRVTMNTEQRAAATGRSVAFLD